MYNKIKNIRMYCRKAGIASPMMAREATFWATVMGDIQLKAEKVGCKDDPTDKVSLAVIKSYLKRYSTEALAGRATAQMELEVALLEELLPEQASLEDVLEAIQTCNPQTMKDMGSTVKYIKESLGEVDMATTSSMIKTYISKFSH